MEDQPSQGEFHHYQIVNGMGQVPFSISVLLRSNTSPANEMPAPLEIDDVIAFHEQLRTFDGDYIKAFSAPRS